MTLIFRRSNVKTSTKYLFIRLKNLVIAGLEVLKPLKLDNSILIWSIMFIGLFFYLLLIKKK